jgi:hypothetical protein
VGQLALIGAGRADPLNEKKVKRENLASFWRKPESRTSLVLFSSIQGRGEMNRLESGSRMGKARWAFPLIGLVSLAVIAQDDQTTQST